MVTLMHLSSSSINKNHELSVLDMALNIFYITSFFFLYRFQINNTISNFLFFFQFSSKKITLQIALIATIIDSNDKNDYRKNKKQITKKQYQRQNKNIQQRNGPIIRQKKMFTHINGIYHNRNNC